MIETAIVGFFVSIVKIARDVSKKSGMLITELDMHEISIKPSIIARSTAVAYGNRAFAHDQTFLDYFLHCENERDKLSGLRKHIVGD